MQRFLKNRGMHNFDASENLRSENISIALCTYNGARFIGEQLRSIAAQTYLPDELIICDDCSTDGTLDIVAKFASLAPFKVAYSKNNTQLGVTRNFERAISLCTGELIFLSDQDDYWLPDKIEKLVQPFRSDEYVGLVFSDAVVTDSKLNQFNYTMWETVEFTKRRQRQLNDNEALYILIRQYVVTGATLVFRASLREHILPIPSNNFHDAWIATVSAMVSKIVAIDTPLVLYRQHDANVIGAPRMGFYARLCHMFQMSPQWVELEHSRAISLMQKMQTISGFSKNSHHITDLIKKIQHLEGRMAMVETDFFTRFSLISRELFSFRYFMFSGGVGAAILDFFLRNRQK